MNVERSKIHPGRRVEISERGPARWHRAGQRRGASHVPAAEQQPLAASQSEAMGLPSRLRQLTRAVARQPPEDCSPPRRAVDGISLTPGTAAGTAAAAAAAAVAWSAPPLAGPYDEQLGPYPVGVASLQLNDHTRSDSESALGVRSLLTEVWFPADDVARSMPANQFSEFVLRGMVPGSIPLVEKELSSYGRELTIEQLDSEWHNVAVRDAPVRPSATPAQGYPLIVFSHGNSATRFGYTYLCEMLASHGYVVAAPDHTGNCRFTLLDGAYVPMGGPRNGSSDSPTGQSALDRPRDVSFVIDEMARLSAGGDSRWAGRIDCSKVGCSGGSFGGYTTMAAAEIDDRIAAIMPLVAGGPLPLGEKRKNTSTPAMVLVGALDAVVDNRLSKQYYVRVQALASTVPLAAPDALLPQQRAG